MSASELAPRDAWGGAAPSDMRGGGAPDPSRGDTPGHPQRPREVYLDYAAATPMAPEVIEAMLPYLGDEFHNPSAPYAAARRVRDAYERARTTLAHAIGAKPGHIVVTAGATEANNLAFAAVDGPCVVPAIEHESVLAAAKATGATVLGVGAGGLVAPDDVRAALTPQTTLVSVSLANGELGTIQPLREISSVIAAERRRRLAAGERTPLWLHTDASQAFGSMATNVSTLGVDLMTLSAAKLYGPKQVGLLWAGEGVSLRPLVRGGGQEGGIRSGTENVAGAIGFACAVELAERRRKEEAIRLRALRRRLERRLVEAIPWARVGGPRQERRRLPGLLHISFPGLDARRLVILLDGRGVSVGTGSACAASRMRVSHVLAALGVPDEVAAGSIRISLGVPTQAADVDYAADTIVEVVGAECGRTGARHG